MRLEVPDCLPGRNDTDTGSDTEVKTLPTSPHCSSSDLFCSLSDLTTLDSDVPINAGQSINTNHESSEQLVNSDVDSLVSDTSSVISQTQTPSGSSKLSGASPQVLSHLSFENLKRLNSLNCMINSTKSREPVTQPGIFIPPSASQSSDLVPIAFDALFNDLCGDFDSDQMSMANFSVDSDSLHGHSGWSDTESVINMNCAAVLQPYNPSEAGANTPLLPPQCPSVNVSSFEGKGKKADSHIVVAAKIIDAESLLPSKSVPVIINRATDVKSKTDSVLNTDSPSSIPFIEEKDLLSSTTKKQVRSKPHDLLPPDYNNLKSSKSAPPSPKWEGGISNSSSVPPSPKPMRQKKKLKDNLLLSNKDSVLQTPPTPTRRRKHKTGSSDSIVSIPSSPRSKGAKGHIVDREEKEIVKSSNAHDSGHSTASATPSSPPATPSSLPTTPTILSRPSSPAGNITASPISCTPPASPVVCRIVPLQTPEFPSSTNLIEEKVCSSEPVNVPVSEETSLEVNESIPLGTPLVGSPKETECLTKPVPNPPSRPLSPPVSRPLSPVSYRRRSSGALSALSSRRSSLTASRYNSPSTSSYSTTRYSTPSSTYNYTSRYSTPSSSYASSPSAKSSYISPSYTSSYSSPSYPSQNYSSSSYTSSGSLGSAYTSKYTSTPNSYHSSPSSRVSSGARNSKSKENCVIS